MRLIVPIYPGSHSQGLEYLPLDRTCQKYFSAKWERKSVALTHDFSADKVMRTKKGYGSAQNDRINIRKTVMVNISAILIVNDRSIGRSQYVKPRKEKLQLCQLSCER